METRAVKIGSVNSRYHQEGGGRGGVTVNPNLFNVFLYLLPLYCSTFKLCNPTKNNLQGEKEKMLSINSLPQCWFLFYPCRLFSLMCQD